ncbi:unnamed protein product, partial [Vitis vinifera]
MDSIMEGLQPLQMTLLFIIPLILLLGLVSRLRRRRPYPPGPKGLPLIGSMNMMDQLTHRGLAKIAKQYADMAFAHYGPFWRQMRKLCVMKLFSRKRAESWESVREEVESTVRTVASSIGSPVNIGELVFTLTKNIIYRAAFGTSSKEGQDEFISILQEFSKLFGAFNIADFIPWLSWVDPQGLNARLAKARKSLDDEVDTDMVDDLLAFYSEEAKVNESEDLQNAIELTRDNIKAIIMDVMFGGTETVASAIEWAMAEMMKSPEDLKKVQQELADVVGLNRRVEESDLEKLTYLKVMINAWAIGRDKNSWDEPETFKPSRFLKAGVPDFKGSNFEFIPFGSGRRSCPGMQLGLYALELAVVHLLHCFTWELPDGMKPSELDMGDVFGLTAPRATRLVAVPSPRLECPLS